MPPRSTLKQPPLRQPLEKGGQETDALALGAQGLLCRIEFWVEGSRQLAPLRFFVDSGASYSYLNKSQAIEHGIAIPGREMETVRRTLTASGPATSTFRVGRLRGWWHAGLAGHPMDWPVMIRMDDPPGAPPLLGLGGVVRVCRWVIDGTLTPAEPFGVLTMEDLR